MPQANVTRNWSEGRARVRRAAEHSRWLGTLGRPAAILLLEDRPYGMIVGTRYQRNDNGQHDHRCRWVPAGRSRPARRSARSSPTWLANFSTSFRYRAVGVSGLLDVRRGGKHLQWRPAHTIPAGTAEITEKRNDNFTFDGVTASGQPNTTAGRAQPGVLDPLRAGRREPAREMRTSCGCASSACR